MCNPTTEWVKVLLEFYGLLATASNTAERMHLPRFSHIQTLSFILLKGKGCRLLVSMLLSCYPLGVS